MNGHENRRGRKSGSSASSSEKSFPKFDLDFRLGDLVDIFWDALRKAKGKNRGSATEERGEDERDTSDSQDRTGTRPDELKDPSTSWDGRSDE